MSDFYRKVPDHPQEMSSSSVLTRLIDGIGFRYYWATNGLVSDDSDFKPCEGSMNLQEVMQHVLKITYIIGQSFGRDGGPTEPELPSRIEDIRSETLGMIEWVRGIVANMSDEELAEVKFVRSKDLTVPIWTMISGPLTDILTHIGQINSWRRMAGKPSPKINYMKGVPPE